MSVTLTLEDLRTTRQQVGEVLAAGGLVVAPTDTVYGLLARVEDAHAMSEFHAARATGPQDPVTVLIHNPRSVSGYAGAVPEAAQRLLASYWPGPLTLVLPVGRTADWQLGEATWAVGLRMPAEPLLLQVLYDVGPLACSAASPAGQAPPTTVAEAGAALGDVAALWVDDGPRDAPRSTIVDATGPTAAVLREGAVPAADVATVARGDLPWGARPPARSLA